MSNMSVKEYADYQMLWSIVALTQPIISLGGQNRMRLRVFLIVSRLLLFKYSTDNSNIGNLHLSKF